VGKCVILQCLVSEGGKLDRDVLEPWKAHTSSREDHLSNIPITSLSYILLGVKFLRICTKIECWLCVSKHVELSIGPSRLFLSFSARNGISEIPSR